MSEKLWTEPGLTIQQRVDAAYDAMLHGGNRLIIIQEAIEAACAEVVAEVAPKWVPVTERLPVTSPNGTMHGVLIFGEVLDIGHYDPSNQTWYWRTQRSGIEPVRVSHWMPLPAPPQEDAP